MSNENHHRETHPSLTRRTALGALGMSAAGLAVSGSASANENDGDSVTVTGSMPNTAPLVQADGSEWPDEPDEDTELFDAEPEFPPFTNFEGMKEEHDPGDVNRYLQPHGVTNLLASRRLVVHPDGAEDGAVTWAEFTDAEAAAHIECRAPSSGRGEGGGQARSHVEIEFEGLIPHGVYTVWVVHEPGYHRPLGGNDGDENYFTATGEGSYTLEMTDGPDELTLPPGEESDDIPITQEPLHAIAGEFFFVVAYHYDNRVWGSQPGPFWVPHIVVNQFDGD